MKLIDTRILLLVSLLLMQTACGKEEAASNATDSAAAKPLPELTINTEPLERGNAEAVFSYADMLEEVTPGVVSVYTSRIVRVPSRNQRQGPRSPMEDFLRRFYGLPDEPTDPRAKPDEEEGRERKFPYGSGSGFLVTADGYILTNNHVVSGGRRNTPADEIIVKLPDGREFEAELVGTDPQTDIAVLKIESEEPFTHLTLTNSSQLRVGDVVFAVGNPLRVGQTVTQGIVSATGRTDLGILGFEGYENFIQTDAAINLGNSGGPLVDARGRVVGINTAIISGTGGSIGIGFAIPVNLARTVMTSLLDTGTVRRGFLGVGIQNLDRNLALSMGLETTRGALVTDVQPGLPAEEAGLRHGDVIVRVGDAEVDSAADLRFLISRIEPGSDVELGVVRNGEMMDVSVRLGDREELISGILEEEGMEQPETVLEGVMMVPVDEQAREELSIPENVNGLLVGEVSPESPYLDTLQPGMIIMEVNGQPVTSASALSEALKTDAINHLYIWFEGRKAYQSLRLAE